MEIQHCQHEELAGSNCRSCGVYVDGEIHGLKSTVFSSPELLSTQLALKAIRKRSAKFKPTDFPTTNHNLNEFLAGIVAKFRFSCETHALGLYFFHGVVTKRISFSYNQLLYGSVCILLAAKSLEKDRLVPRMSALRKAACSYLAVQEYTKAERSILEMLEYNLDICTFATFIDLYLCSGVLFTNELSKSWSVSRLENLIVQKMSELIKNAKFMGFEPQKLAIYIIAHARLQLGLPSWSQHLQESLVLRPAEVEAIFKQLEPRLIRPELIPMHFRTVKFITVKDLPEKKIDLSGVGRDSLRDKCRNVLTVITNDRSLRDARSLVTVRR